MPKFYGAIGYALPEEIKPGVVAYTNIAERMYKGDFVKRTTKWNPSDDLNDNLELQDDISIVADEYAYTHSNFMKYATLFGTKWRIKSISISRPRITISLGGVYND